MPLQFTCEHCGKQFSVPPSRAAQNPRFCSRRCYMAVHQTRQELTCLSCQRTFSANAFRVRHVHPKFCSVSCKSNYARTLRVSRTCVQCGTQFSVSSYEAGRGAGSYCSQACAHVGLRNATPGNHRNDHWYDTWRQAVLERDRYACQDCGTTEVKLHAHHIKHWDDFPELRYDVSNGKALCHACHNRVHHLAESSVAPESSEI
jgi:5-methylcytosine-specific restriction endonuclease McrA